MPYLLLPSATRCKAGVVVVDNGFFSVIEVADADADADADGWKTSGKRTEFKYPLENLWPARGKSEDGQTALNIEVPVFGCTERWSSFGRGPGR